MRGRPKSVEGPVVTTTVRIPIAEWRWVKDHGAEFSSLLRKQIRSEIREVEQREAMAYLATKRDLEANTPIGKFKQWIGDQHSQGRTPTSDEIGAKRKELGL